MITIRKEVLFVVAVIVLCVACFVGGRYTSSGEDDYYRGIYDLCRSMVMMTGQWVDCQGIADTAKDSDWWEQDSNGFIVPSNNIRPKWQGSNASS
jgi:hypothetical protein